MPWCLKLDNSSLPKENVEGCHSGLCLCPDCLLHVFGCSSWGMGLDMHVLGELARVLVVFGATACIILL